ncbi:MAG: hypothetical protein LBM19_01555 [Holosporales bacterium]|jgi:hypothetical protein|nr:hypothetical protein [Holosporales bacterium]
MRFSNILMAMILKYVLDEPKYSCKPFKFRCGDVYKNPSLFASFNKNMISYLAILALTKSNYILQPKASH